MRGVMRESNSSSGGEREAVSGAERIGDRGGPREIDHRFVDGEAGVGIQDLGAGVAEHQRGERHRHLAAGHDDDLAGRDLHAEPPRRVGGDRLAQRGDAARGRVAVVAVAEGPARGLDDVRRRREIGLADTEVDHRAAPRREGLGARQHLERALGAEAGDVGRDHRGSSGGSPRRPVSHRARRAESSRPTDDLLLTIDRGPHHRESFDRRAPLVSATHPASPTRWA